jgi:hypothetical protein
METSKPGNTYQRSRDGESRASETGWKSFWSCNLKAISASRKAGIARRYHGQVDNHLYRWLPTQRRCLPKNWQEPGWYRGSFEALLSSLMRDESFLLVKCHLVSRMPFERYARVGGFPNPKQSSTKDKDCLVTKSVPRDDITEYIVARVGWFSYPGAIFYTRGRLIRAKIRLWW